METSQFKSNFEANLPRKPYCTNYLGQTFISTKEIAIKERYIQINPPQMIVYLIFDVDHPEAVMAWYDANLPMPTWTAQNPKNGHAHIVYELKFPVCTSDAAKQKIIRYLKAVRRGMAHKLGADMGYAHLLTKNPSHNHWRVTNWTTEKYELDYLADFVDLTLKPSFIADENTLGRNCTIFDTSRYWAYEAIRSCFKENKSFSYWYSIVLNQTANFNANLPEPLPHAEVKSIAKSIASWVWHNQKEAYSKFIKRQSNKGKLGAIAANRKGANRKGGKSRSDQYSDLRHEALKLHILGVNNTQISEQLKVSRRTIINWLKQVKLT